MVTPQEVELILVYIIKRQSFQNIRVFQTISEWGKYHDA
jgi:hypothetical protein